MALLSMLKKEFEFTFLILQFGAVLELLHWMLRILAIEFLKLEVAWYPPPLDLVLLFTSLQQNECPLFNGAI
jgi:hypothetical protein